MADQSISQLPVATTITGDELTVVVQNGITKQTQVSDIANAISPGKLIDYLYFDTGSDLIVVYTDSTTQNLGPIPGYIAASIRSDGHLILTNSTGGTTDAGSVFATLSQTFITKNNESATLPNSQQLIAGSNIALAYGTNSVTISTSGASGSLNGAGTGFIVKDSSNTVIARTLTSTAGISITNPDGLAGNPIISPASKLADIQNLATTGILAVVGGTTVIDRNIVGTASQITVVGGDGSANPTISIASNPVLPGTGSFVVPTGDTSQRPGALAGQLRFNTSLNVFEGQNNSGVWQTLALGGGVTSVGSGTGLTGGPITSTGTLSIANTGVTATTYGSASTVPQIAVNAQGQITSASNVTITPSGIGAISSVSGTANEITATTVGTAVTVSLPTALTFTGKTVTGGTLTGVSINGSTNTLTNIANSSLTNSSLTVGTTAISLGATSLTLGGLTSVAVTQDPVSALQLATKQYVDNVAQGLDAKASVRNASTVAFTATYANGTAGVGATLTNTGTLAAFAADGVTNSVGDRVLIKNQAAALQNGIYTVTTAGSGSVAWVLTRATDMDTWAEVPNSFVFVEDGSTQADTGWVCTSNAGGTMGTTAITWVQFSGAGTYSAGTGLTLTGTVFSITNTAVTAGSYGSASTVPTYTVNAQGQLTAASNTTISIAPSQINATIPNSGLTNSSITINGSAISLGGSVSVGTVTSVAALTLGTTGTDLSSTVATGTTTPVITLNVPTASATNRGALSAADWTTFNSKANAFTYTTNYIPYGQGTTTPLQSANLTFNGTNLTVGTAGVSSRIQGDFSNATFASRTAFQTGTTNGSTGIYALPNGTSTAASWQAFNNADPTNASKILIATNGSTDVQLVSGINGTGTYLPMTFWNNGAEKARLSVAGGFSIGTATDAGSTNLLVAGTTTALGGIAGGTF